MALKTSQFPPVLIADKTATILAGQLTSGSVDLLGTVLVGMLTTDPLVENTILRFFASIDGVNFLPLVNDANVPHAVNVRPNKHIALDILDFASVRHIQVVVDLLESSDITFQLITRPAL